MPRKKSPLEPTVRRKRAYELGGLTNVQAAPDPIRDIENEAIRDLSNEYRMLRIEEMITKKKRQLGAIANPSSNIQLQKDNLALFKGMIDIAKSAQPASGPDKSIEFAKLITTIYGEIIKNQNRGSPSFFENLLMDPNLYNRAQSLGIFGNRGEGKDMNAFSVEIEKLRGERDLQNRRFDLEIQKSRLQHEDSRYKMDLALRAIGPMLNIAGNSLAKDAYATGRNIAGHINPNQTQAQNSYASGELATIEIVCDCGFSKSMLLPDPPPGQVPCPGCGTLLNVGTEIPSDEESASVWRNEPESGGRQ